MIVTGVHEPSMGQPYEAVGMHSLSPIRWDVVEQDKQAVNGMEDTYTL